jgi:hypothetical protein
MNKSKISVRPASPNDKALIESWLADDEFHQSIGITIEDAYKNGTQLAIVSDSVGPLMAVRLELFPESLHAAIQYNPHTRLRNVRAMGEVIGWWKDMAMAVKRNAITVKPGGRAIRLAERLGFKDSEVSGVKVLKCE